MKKEIIECFRIKLTDAEDAVLTEAVNILDRFIVEIFDNETENIHSVETGKTFAYKDLYNSINVMSSIVWGSRIKDAWEKK